jgi:hypothetical protein
MERTSDTMKELAAITAEMARMQDLGGRRLSDLLEQRGTLIRRLIADHFDADDPRLASIVSDADELQERLRKRADSIRDDLASLNATGTLMRAVRSTLNAPEQNELNISA